MNPPSRLQIQMSSTDLESIVEICEYLATFESIGIDITPSDCKRLAGLLTDQLWRNLEID